MSTFFECCKIWLWRNRWLVFRLSFSLRLPVYHLKLYDWFEIWFALNPLFTNRDNIGGDHCCVLKQPDARYRSPLLGFSSASNETPSPCSLLCGSPLEHQIEVIRGSLRAACLRRSDILTQPQVTSSWNPKSLQTFPAVPEEQHRSSFVVV